MHAPNALAHLAALELLRTLELQAARRTSGAPLADDAAALAELRRLQELRLRQCGATPPGAFPARG